MSRRVTILLTLGLLFTLIPMSVGLAQAPEPQTYIVQPGDTIYSIAAMFGVDPFELAAYNGLADMNSIAVGMELAIPGTVYPNNCEDGSWTVRPGQTLYQIAHACHTSVAALLAYNGLSNPNLVNPGQVILIPPPDYSPDEGAASGPPTAPATAEAPAPAAAEEEAPAAPSPAATAAPAPSAGGAVNVSFSNIRYSLDGRVADLTITIGNVNVLPAVAGGRYYVERNPDGGVRYVTLIGAVHDFIPYPQITTELLWHATVTTDDGMVFPAYAGCIYRETVHARGYEPTGPTTGFHWEQTLVGGWFDCGNEYRVTPDDLPPSAVGSTPLTIYLVHPRLYDQFPTVSRRVIHIDLEIFDALGRSLGTVASVNFN